MPVEEEPVPVEEHRFGLKVRRERECGTGGNDRVRRRQPERGRVVRLQHALLNQRLAAVGVRARERDRAEAALDDRRVVARRAIADGPDEIERGGGDAVLDRLRSIGRDRRVSGNGHRAGPDRVAADDADGAGAVLIIGEQQLIQPAAVGRGRERVQRLVQHEIVNLNVRHARAEPDPVRNRRTGGVLQLPHALIVADVERVGARIDHGGPGLGIGERAGHGDSRTQVQGPVA